MARIALPEAAPAATFVGVPVADTLLSGLISGGGTGWDDSVPPERVQRLQPAGFVLLILSWPAGLVAGPRLSFRGLAFRLWRTPQSASSPGMRRSEPPLKPSSPDVSNWTSRVDRDRPRCSLFPSDQTGLPGHFSSER